MTSARLIVGLRDRNPGGTLIDSIRAGRVGGLLVFRSALPSTVEAAAEMIARLRNLWPAGASPLMTMDEEGGLIQQTAGLLERGEAWWRLPSPRSLGFAQDPEIAFTHGRETGRRLRRLGIDMTFAPVVDLDPGRGSRVLGTRCFGADPETVAGLALAWLRGLAAAGVRGCLKHYPGHGATTIDSHEDLPRIPASVDLSAHRSAFDRIARGWRDEYGPPPCVMMAHLLLPERALPASMDREVYGAIPPGLGLRVCDSLEMGALRRFGSIGERMAASASAGAEILIVGVEVESALAAAQEIDWDRCPVVEMPALPGDAPIAWSPIGVERAAAPGVRVTHAGPIPAGAWDWLLPARVGPYGPTADPPSSPDLPRRIARVIRYRHGDPTDLGRCLSSVTRPALVGWAHRGSPDSGTAEVLKGNETRVQAVAHLLDGADGPIQPTVWTAETCGFGEAELAVLQEVWRAAAIAR